MSTAHWHHFYIYNIFLKKKNNLKLLITGIYETTWLSIITVALQHTKETIYMYRKSIKYDSFPTSWKYPSLTTRIAARLPYDHLNTIMMPLVDLKFIDNKRVTKGNINIFLCNFVCFCFICIITSMQHYLKIFSIPCNVECLRLILGFNQQSVEIHM